MWYAPKVEFLSTGHTHMHERAFAEVAALLYMLASSVSILLYCHARR